MTKLIVSFAATIVLSASIGWSAGTSPDSSLIPIEGERIACREGGASCKKDAECCSKKCNPGSLTALPFCAY